MLGEKGTGIVGGGRGGRGPEALSFPNDDASGISGTTLPPPGGNRGTVPLLGRTERRLYASRRRNSSLLSITGGS
jgi:hypothetical protein